MHGRKSARIRGTPKYRTPVKGKLSFLESDLLPPPFSTAHILGKGTPDFGTVTPDQWFSFGLIPRPSPFFLKFRWRPFVKVFQAA